MDWELELHNRLPIGFALGWAYYGRDQEHDWSEINIFHWAYRYNIKILDMSDYVNGLYVKDGRLINGRPNGMNGIEQAAGLRKMVKYNKKVEMIADGIERAKNREDYFM